MRESANPPVLTETLTPESAGRLAAVITAQITSHQFATYFQPVRFVGYLSMQLGLSGVDLPISVVEGARALTVTHSGYIDNASHVLRQHIVGFVAHTPLQVQRFLEWFTQFLRDELPGLEEGFGGGSRGYSARVDAEEFTEKVIALVNGSLEHDGIAFRIVADSEFVYAVHQITNESLQVTAIDPAFRLLRESEFAQATDEYEQALREFAHGNYSNAVTHASHAVESTMKAILRDVKGDASCDALTASQLTKEIADAGLLPARYENIWNNLRTLLQASPTVRNKEAGAGHGPPPGAEEPDSIVAEFSINTAGSSIVFLAKRWQEGKAT